MNVELISPEFGKLPAYEAALGNGWSPDPRRTDEAFTDMLLAELRRDRRGFFEELIRTDDLVTLADGRTVPRLPTCFFWIWDGTSCGTIELRFQRGTDDLPPYVAGHVGYSVVPWKQQRGYATMALGQLLPVAAGKGLSRITVLCNEDNLGSRRVIERNGGMLVKVGPHPSDAPERIKLHFELSVLPSS